MDKAIRFAYHPAWRLVTIAALLAAVFLLAACGGKGGSASAPRSITPSQSAAIATARADARDYVGACVPKDAAHQILLGKSLLGKDGRQKFAACLAIPKASRPAFEAASLAAAEHVKWSDKGQRRQFFAVTLPALAEKYHAPAAAASPAATASPSAS